MEEELDFSLGERNLLITFHPVTLEQNTSAQQMRELLLALAQLEQTQLIFTMPNADTQGRVIFGMIEEFVKQNPERAKPLLSGSTALPLLPQTRECSCWKFFKWVGRSSSFQIGTVNIGERQTGRIKAASVIDCVPDRHSIKLAFEKLYSSSFQEQLAKVRNPYGEGGASKKTVKILEEYSFDGLLKKKFYDS